MTAASLLIRADGRDVEVPRPDKQLLLDLRANGHVP
jgi:hypothetical protein